MTAEGTPERPYAFREVVVLSTPRGPMLAVSPDVALLTAALVGRWLAQVPADAARPHPDLLRLRTAALRTSRMAGAGMGWADDVPGTAPAVDWLTVAEAAEREGITERGMRRRLASGEVPGARQERGRWLIPAGLYDDDLDDLDERDPVA